MLYAYNPVRDAVMIIGGDKTGDDRFYERTVKKAEALAARGCRGSLRGRGMRGRSCSMSSNGVNTTASVPAENRRLNRSATRPSGNRVSRSVATGGRARERNRRDPRREPPLTEC